jgi:hypothetical protein
LQDLLADTAMLPLLCDGMLGCDMKIPQAPLQR